MYGAVREEVSESWLHTYDLSSTMIPNVSSSTDDEEHFCKLILYKEIKDSGVRIWDIVILVPNLLFLLFIAVRFNRARLKLRATSSPIFLAFYGLVICNVVISVIRCVVSMTVNAAATVGGKADKILWVTVRFFLLSTEMSVVIFGLAFGHLDSRSSIRRVLLATSLIALAFTITQGTLELVLPDDTFRIASRNFYVFGHGGMMFWFCSSLVFTMIYLFILILPWTRLRDRLTLPTRKSFYIYAGTLATLDLVQSIGAGFLNYTQNPVGLCIVDFTAAVYLTLFTPLVYHTFLSEFFGVSQPSIMFSYKAQVDDAMDEDTVSLPHQQSFSSLKTDSDYIYQVHTPSIYMPLDDSQASTSSPLKHHKTSLQSLTLNAKASSRRATSSSPTATLHRSTSDVRDFARRLSGERSIFDSKTYSRTRSDNFIDVKGDAPEPRGLEHDTSWKSKSTSQFKYGGSGSVSNLFFPDTASKYLVRPGTNDSNINLFSLTRKSSLDRKQLGQNASAQFYKNPRLEDTLRSILDSNLNACSETKHGSGPNQESVSMKENIGFRRLSAQGSAASSNEYVDNEMSEAEDTLLDQKDVSRATDRLIFKPYSLANERGCTDRKKADAKRAESGGLSDYLLLMRSSGVHKDGRNAEVDSGSSSFPRTKPYAQTDSL